MTGKFCFYSLRILAAKFSITRPEEVSSFGLPSSPKYADGQLTLSQSILANRYYIIGWGWVSVLTGLIIILLLFSATLIYNFYRKDVRMAQKLINARMVAQASVLLGIGAMISLTSFVNSDKQEEQPQQNDAYFERIVNSKAN